MTPAPFDPNAALRDFNQYFATLRKQHGDAGLRAMGFSPSDLARMQADLRKLQMDPNSTPEQHRQAYQQARDALAQRITTPAAAPQSVGQPIREVRPTLPVPEIQLPMPSMPVAPPMPSMPVAPPLPVSKHVDPEGPLPPEDIVVKGRPYMPPLPPADIVVERRPPDMLPVSNYIAQMNAPVAAPGGSTNFNEATGVYTKPGNPLTDVLKNAGQVVGGAPSGGMGMLGSMTPAAPAPTPTFDRNAALQQLNKSFANLRNTYGVDALRGAGFAPSNLSALQADLRKLQLDNSSTQEQHTAALQNALNTMNSYTNNLKPITPSQTGMALPMAPAPQPMAPPPLIKLPLQQPNQGSFVDTMPKINMPQDPTYRFMQTPQPMPAPTPAPVQGMALGGLMAKYRGGMC